MIDLFFKKLEENVKYPLRAHERDAGFDIYLKEDGEDDYIVIMPGKQLKLSTGIAVQGKFTNPEDSKKWVIKFQIEGTSGNAAKLGISPIGGVIDEEYVGEIGVVLINHTSEPIKLKKGNKIAQLVPEVLPHINSITYLGVEDKFKETDRGSAGFGSTGIAN